MSKHRSFVMLVVASLVVMAALLVTQALAVAQAVTTTQSHFAGAPSSITESSCPLSAADIRSIHGVYVKEIGLWFPYTSHGPTGVDGGALELLSHACSR